MNIRLNLEDYQKAAKEFAAYDDDVYPFLGLAEETGEFLGLIAKSKRGDDLAKRFGDIGAARLALLKEAGDVLWQLSQCLTELNLSLQDAAELNLQKLTDRKERAVIKGSGDDR